MADKDRRVRLEEKKTNKEEEEEEEARWYKQKKKRTKKKKKIFVFNAMNYYEHRILESDFYQVPWLITMKNDYWKQSMIVHHSNRIY